MTILDSSVWIAFLNIDDSQHKKAESVFSDIARSEEKVVITEYVVLEVCTLLRAVVGKHAADTFIKYLFDNNDIYILPSNEKFFFETLSVFHQSSHTKLSFIDISLLVLSKQYRVISFDKTLAKQCKKV